MSVGLLTSNDVNYLDLLAHGRHRSLLEGGGFSPNLLKSWALSCVLCSMQFLLGELR